MSIILSLLQKCAPLIISILIVSNTYSQPIIVEAGQDTAFVLQLDKTNCLNTGQYPSPSVHVANNAPYLYVTLNYTSNCGTVDFLDVVISQDSIYLTQADTGSILACACEYNYSMIFQHYSHDTAYISFGNTSAVYPTDLGVTESIMDFNNLLIANPVGNELNILWPVTVKKENYLLEITDLAGQNVYLGKVCPGEQEPDISGLKPSSYISVISKDGVPLCRQQIIKM